MAYYVQTQAGLKGPIPNPKLAQLLQAGKLTPQTRLYDQQGQAVTTVSRALQPAAKPAAPAGLDLDGIVDSLKAERAQPASPPPPPAAKRAAAVPAPAGVDLDDIVSTLKQERSAPAAPPRRPAPAAPSAGIDLDDIVNTLKAEEAPAPARRSAAVEAPAGVDLDGIVQELKSDSSAPSRVRRPAGRGARSARSTASRPAPSTMDNTIPEAPRLTWTMILFRTWQVLGVLGVLMSIVVVVRHPELLDQSRAYQVGRIFGQLLFLGLFEWIIRGTRNLSNAARVTGMCFAVLATLTILLAILAIPCLIELSRAKPAFVSRRRRSPRSAPRTGPRPARAR